jgi:gamma-glutamylcyclotransferase (GGCT)/AIG2-like uncharacterized protein YtfP
MFAIFKDNKQEEVFPNNYWLIENRPRSWDAWKLEQYIWQPVFIYDQLMRKHRMNHLLENHSQFQCTAYTWGSNWTLWKKRLGLGTFPIPLRIPMTGVEQGRIKGEIYKVRSSRIIDLDEYKLNGVEFRRKKVDLLIPYRRQQRIVNEDHNYETINTDLVAHVEAWMYVGRYKYWQDFIDAGYNFKTCKIYEPHGSLLIGKYYSFSNQEYYD